MPLRDLIYIAKELEPLLQNDSPYSSTLLEIPTPRFVVFYNGEKKQPERRVLKLSDAFRRAEDEPLLELKVIMLNINPGYNQEIMAQCQTLIEYSNSLGRSAHLLRRPYENVVAAGIQPFAVGELQWAGCVTVRACLDCYGIYAICSHCP